MNSKCDSFFLSFFLSFSFDTKRKQRFFFLVTQWPLAKWSHWPGKSWTPAQQRRHSALSYCLFLFLFKNKIKTIIVKLLCTVLHNIDEASCCYIMITHLESVLDSHNAALWVKKKIKIDSLKKYRPLVANRGQPFFSCSCVFPFRYSSMQPCSIKCRVSYQIT